MAAGVLNAITVREAIISFSLAAFSPVISPFFA
jgi:hypothetical protein